MSIENPNQPIIDSFGKQLSEMLTRRYELLAELRELDRDIEMKRWSIRQLMTRIEIPRITRRDDNV